MNSFRAYLTEREDLDEGLRSMAGSFARWREKRNRDKSDRSAKKSEKVKKFVKSGGFVLGPRFTRGLARASRNAEKDAKWYGGRSDTWRKIADRLQAEGYTAADIEELLI